MSSAKSVGRPLGEFAVAVLGAIVRLETPDRAPTVREIRDHLCSTAVRQINDREMRSTIISLKARERVEVKRKRVVEYCCKPVDEIGLTIVDQPADINAWYAGMSMWMGVRK